MQAHDFQNGRCGSCEEAAAAPAGEDAAEAAAAPTGEDAAEVAAAPAGEDDAADADEDAETDGAKKKKKLTPEEIAALEQGATPR